MKDFQALKTATSSLISFNKDKIVPREQANRERRELPFTKEKLREDGSILADDIYIPMRIINDNIRRDMPQYTSWLRMPQRLILLKDPLMPAKSFEMLEGPYTDGLRYTNWDEPYYLAADSAELHGVGYVKVLYDPAAPLHVSVSFLNYSEVLFDKECRDLQRQAVIAIKSFWIQEEILAQEEFNKEVVKKLIGENKDGNKQYELYQVFYKVNGIVWSCWHADSSEDYLREPKPYEAGRGAIETVYPVFDYRLFVTEDRRLAMARGRAYYDSDIQEAVTVTWTSVISANKRASGFYPTTDGEIDEKAASKFVLERGKLSPYKLKLNQFPYPPSTVLTTVDSLVRQNQANQGYTDFAAMNRVDSGKTATEINAAREVKTEQAGQVLSNFSVFFQRVHTYIWSLVQHYAMNDQIKLYGETVAKVLDPATGKTVSVFVNDKESLDREFSVVAAGDVEFSRRQQLKELYATYGQQFAGTPLGKVITYDLLLTMFPEQGRRYADIYKKFNVQNDVAVTLMEGILQRVQTGQLIQPQELAQINEQLAQLKQLYGGSSGLFLEVDDASTDGVDVETAGATPSPVSAISGTSSELIQPPIV